jgi:hypothetical protein
VFEFHHPNRVLDRAEDVRRRRPALARRDGLRPDVREEDVLLFRHVGGHLLGEVAHVPRNRRQLGVTGPVRCDQALEPSLQARERRPHIAMVAIDNVIGQAVGLPRRVVLVGRAVGGGQFGQGRDDRRRIDIGSAARFDDRPLAAAAEIEAVPRKDLGGPIVGRDDVTQGLMLRCCAHGFVSCGLVSSGSDHTLSL